MEEAPGLRGIIVPAEGGGDVLLCSREERGFFVFHGSVTRLMLSFDGA